MSLFGIDCEIPIEEYSLDKKKRKFENYAGLSLLKSNPSATSAPPLRSAPAPERRHTPVNNYMNDTPEDQYLSGGSYGIAREEDNDYDDNNNDDNDNNNNNEENDENDNGDSEGKIVQCKEITNALGPNVDIESAIQEGEPVENLIARADAWFDLWCPNDQKQSEMDVFKRIRGLFGAADDGETLATDALEHRYHSILFNYSALCKALAENGLADDSSTDQLIRQRHGQMLKISENIFYALHILTHLGHLRFINNARAQAILPDNLLTVRFNPPDYTGINKFQQLLIFYLNKAQQKRYRKVGSTIYEPLLTKDGKFRHAWKPKMEISEFIYHAVCPKEHNMEMWRCLTDRGNNGKNAADYLEHASDTEFPFLRKNKKLRGFTNGVYDIGTDTFYELGDPRLTPNHVCSHFFEVPFENDLYEEVLATCSSPACPAYQRRKATIDSNNDQSIYSPPSSAASSSSSSSSSSSLSSNLSSLNSLSSSSSPLSSDTNNESTNNESTSNESTSNESTSNTGNGNGNGNSNSSVNKSNNGNSGTPSNSDKVTPNQTLDKMNEISPSSLSSSFLKNKERSVYIEDADIDAEDEKNDKVPQNDQNKNKDQKQNKNTIDKKKQEKKDENGEKEEKEEKEDKDKNQKQNEEISDDDLCTCKDDYMKIPTPAVQSIFDYQNLGEEVSRWIYAMIGRLFFDINELEHWEVQLYLKGVGGTGKSSILRLIEYMFDPIDVGIIPNTVEKNYPIMPLLEKAICIGMDIFQNFSLDQYVWQSMVSGEGVTAARKHMSPLTIPAWVTPLVMAGNAVPSWSDNGGSVSRRMLVVRFLRMVRSGDPKLMSKMKKEIAAFIKKCTLAYLSMVQKYGGRIIWDVLPATFSESKDELQSHTNPLEAFVSSDLLLVNPAIKIPMRVFKDRYIQFCKDEGRAAPAWNQDFYGLCFQKHQFTIEGGRHEYHGECYDEKFIIGCDLKSSQTTDNVEE